MEEWRDINGFEGFYQVSSYGRVRSIDRYVTGKDGATRFLRGNMMKLTEYKNPQRDQEQTHYLVVNLRKCGYNRVYMVHRLVAETFIPNPDNLPVPNHIDGNKSNNCVENLEWTTYGENNQHAIDNHLRSPRGRKVCQYDLDENFIMEFKSVTEASRQTGIGRSTISNCLNGRAPENSNYIWKYI